MPHFTDVNTISFSRFNHQIISLSGMSHVLFEEDSENGIVTFEAKIDEGNFLRIYSISNSSGLKLGIHVRQNGFATKILNLNFDEDRDILADFDNSIKLGNSSEILNLSQDCAFELLMRFLNICNCLLLMI